VGPTILTTGRSSPFGGQWRTCPPSRAALEARCLDADTPDEVRKAVRQNICYGANAIKQADNNALLFDRRSTGGSRESHAAGLTCAVHVYGGRPPTT
jgi:hypothetical protein